MAYLWIALGAIFGASARYFLSGYVARHSSAVFPYGTLLINLTGSFVLGFFLIYSTERVLLDPRWRLLVAVGVCGSYTTFSSYEANLGSDRSKASTRYRCKECFSGFSPR